MYITYTLVSNIMHSGYFSEKKVSDRSLNKSSLKSTTTQNYFLLTCLDIESAVTLSI